MNQEQKDIQEIIETADLFLNLNHSKLLVTGATGLIGSMIVKAVLAAKEKYGLKVEVIGQIRDTEKAKRIYGDLFHLVEYVKDPHVDCDYIIHTASPTSSKYFIEHPVETINASVKGTMEILEIAKDNNANAVYLSSMEQYGIPYQSGQKMSENDIGIIDHLSPRSSYSESKRLCECLCSAYSSEFGVDIKVARLAQTFGSGIPLEDNRMPMQFAKAVCKGNDIILYTEGNSISNYVYITDAITGILTILLSGESGQAYNVCNDKESRSVREIADLIASHFGEGNIKVRIEKQNNMGFAPTAIMFLDSSKLQSLGWTAKIDMIEAYGRLTEYLKNG